MQVEQRCRRCGVDKPQEAYHPRKWGQVGNYCRACCADYKREARRAAGVPERVPRSGREARPRELSATYRAVHARVQRARGRAAALLCECGDPAAEWAYDHADPSPLRGTTPRGRSVEYSADAAHYVARCKPCHARDDRRL